MLGYNSERLLKNLLVGVGDGERDSESARQRLCNIRDFAPYSAFGRIDRDNSGSLSPNEIINFLRDNGVYHVQYDEAQNLINFFDSDGNRRLSFNEFLQMCLPCEDNLLRNITLDRPSRTVMRWEKLPTDIELALTSVIEKEINLQRKLEILKRECGSQYDYSPYAAFRSIDRYNSGRIDTVSVGSFCRQNGHFASELELLAMIRRMDTDGDATVNYSEFAEFVRPLIPMPRPLSYPEPPRPLSPARTASSPMRTSSPQRSYSAGRPSAAMATPPRVSPSRKVTLRPYVEDELVRNLKEQCNLEAEIETQKIRLGQNYDFNLSDCWGIFDVPRYGSIGTYELQRGLQEVGVFATTDECDLMIQRYDSSGNRRLEYNEFAKMFLADDAYHASVVNRRPANYPVPRGPRRDDCFGYPTKAEHAAMWRTHIRCENAAESLRQNLNNNPGFNSYEGFNSLDLNEDNRVSATEIRRMIESRGYFVGMKEVDQVVKKMDKNGDRTVSFNEFADEQRNKSPVRR